MKHPVPLPSTAALQNLGSWLLWKGLALMAFGWVAARGIDVPIVGVVTAIYASDVFIMGTALLALGIAMRYFEGWSRFPIAVIVIIAISLNTRIPSIIEDAVAEESAMQVPRTFIGLPGQPIRIVSNVKELSARFDPYDSVIPACYGEGCFRTRGFQTPNHYWREEIEQTVSRHGFVPAAYGELALELRVDQRSAGAFTSIVLQLRDVDGRELASFAGRYRRGFPQETPDGAIRGRSMSEKLVWEYLLHGHHLMKGIGNSVATTTDEPLQAMLSQAANLSPFNSKPTSPAALQILEERTFDPPQAISNRGIGNAVRPEMLRDPTRSERCREFLRRETAVGGYWHLFSKDPAGRKRVPSFNAKNALCDEDAIWLFDYSRNRLWVRIAKFTPTGDLTYHLVIKAPAEPSGHFGHIVRSTFGARDGQLEFQWWNTMQSGAEMKIVRTIRARVKEPFENPR